jgi:hypothetical protein
MTRSATVGLTELALVALRGEGRKNGGARVAARLARAVRYYLDEEDRERPGWRYPEFLREREEGDAVELELTLAAEEWRKLEAEAERQQVSVARLAEHAALYFVADLNAGRSAAQAVEDGESRRAS